jgi:integrase
MSRARKEPQYLLHRSSGRGRTRVNGKDIYFTGEHNSPKSLAEFEKFRDDWRMRQPGDRPDLTIGELSLRFFAWAQTYYRHRDGTPTGEADNLKLALRPLNRRFGRELVIDFTPSKLKTYRNDLITMGVCRGSINRHTHRVRHLFSWAVEEGFAGRFGGNLFAALKSVKALQPFRTEAPERDPVQPVEMNVVRATYRKLPKVLRTMLHLQLLTASRPGEICSMRLCDIDRTADIWVYQPVIHKNAWRGRARLIHIGPTAQRILAPFLADIDPMAYVFSPVVSERIRTAERRKRRKSPMTPTHRKRDAEGDSRALRSRYTTNVLGRAVRRAALAAGVPAWSPNRLRHTRGTAITDRDGIEIAAAVLGHADSRTTRIYARQNVKAAADLMRQIG